MKIRYPIQCPICQNKFMCDVKSNANGHVFLCECGECETSIECVMNNGMPRIEKIGMLEEQSHE
jgi:transcription elongation factor Elf1